MIEKSGEALQQLNGELLRVQVSCENQLQRTCKDLKATQVELVHQEEAQAHLAVHVDHLNEKLSTLEVDYISVQADLNSE